jgi:uncharacterized protein
MSVDHIRYDILTQDALRGVVRTVLTDAAANGLPGEHHFFISFDTKAEGVRISPRLKAQYPDEMTIVLQHQFWDLVVGDDSFEVGLSFNGIPERLTVPLAAVKAFFDPSVQFQMQFAVSAQEETAANSDTEEAGPGIPALETPAEPEALPAPANPDAKRADKSAKKPKDGAAVVRLDQFRKKK